jgi:hypothetical protein
MRFGHGDIEFQSSAISHLPLTVSSWTQPTGVGELPFDNASAVVSPNIYVTGRGGATKGVVAGG